MSALKTSYKPLAVSIISRKWRFLRVSCQIPFEMATENTTAEWRSLDMGIAPSS
jgi:hypothetical protein